jgi:acylphosphatase
VFKELGIEILLMNVHNLALKGNVKNLEDGTVKVVCEGEEKKY